MFCKIGLHDWYYRIVENKIETGKDILYQNSVVRSCKCKKEQVWNDKWLPYKEAKIVPMTMLQMMDGLSQIGRVCGLSDKLCTVTVNNAVYDVSVRNGEWRVSGKEDDRYDRLYCSIDPQKILSFISSKLGFTRALLEVAQ